MDYVLCTTRYVPVLHTTSIDRAGVQRPTNNSRGFQEIICFHKGTRNRGRYIHTTRNTSKRARLDSPRTSKTLWLRSISSTRPGVPTRMLAPPFLNASKQSSTLVPPTSSRGLDSSSSSANLDTTPNIWFASSLCYAPVGERKDNVFARPTCV